MLAKPSQINLHWRQRAREEETIEWKFTLLDMELDLMFLRNMSMNNELFRNYHNPPTLHIFHSLCSQHFLLLCFWFSLDKLEEWVWWVFRIVQNNNSTFKIQRMTFQHSVSQLWLSINIYVGVENSQLAIWQSSSNDD